MQRHRRLRFGGSQSGFTLVELLGVMVIILVLSAVAVSVFIDITDKARFSTSAGKLTEIEKALERYQVAKGHYPTKLAQLADEGYVRAPETSDEAARYAAFVSPWYDADSDDVKYFYYAVSLGERPKKYLLIDPTPELCVSDAPLICNANPDQREELEEHMVSGLEDGWRSSGNWIWN